METIEVTIKGVSPLLMHRFSEQEQAKVASRTSKRLGFKKPGAAAEEAAYRLPNGGGLYQPAEHIRQAIVGAAGYHKQGRRSAATSAAAGIFVEPEAIPHKSGDYEVDSRPVVVPATRGRVMRHRPRLDDWELSFTILYDESLFDESLVRAILDDAGQKVGIGDFRPSKRGPFGRFMVTEWKAN